MERMVGLLGHPSIASLRLKSLWEEYEARETPESKFVKDLDLFELCVQAVEYENCVCFSRAPQSRPLTGLSVRSPTLQDAARLLRDDRDTDHAPCRQGLGTRAVRPFVVFAGTQT